MTATPTPLRELPAKWRSEACDMRYTTNEPGPHDGARAEELEACADELEAALSARDEAGAVDWTRPIETVKGEPARLAFPLDPAGADVLVHVEIGCGRWAYNLDGTPIQSNGYMPRIRNVATPPASGEAGADLDAEVQAYRQFHLSADLLLIGNNALDIDREGGYEAAIENTLNAIRRLAAVVPAGMVLVPLEPSDAMIDAAGEAALDLDPDESLHGWAQAIWAAMLAAAPTPPATAGKE